ncbi:MAG: hypothetical protein ABIN74_03715, partial [Ferruginibacter sp.]
MKKIFITIIALIIFRNVFSQKFGDSQINVALSDTVMIYEKVVNAFVKSGFTMNDRYNKDTLVTNANSIFNPAGYAVLRAIISGNTVTFNGWYKQQAFGEMFEADKEAPKLKNYKRIIFFTNSSTWRLMNKVAEKLKKEKIISENSQPNITKRSKEVRLRELKDLFEKE